MKNYIKILISVITFSMSYSTIYAETADNVTGTWVSKDKDSHIQIYKCGGNYCARLVWLKGSTDAQGSKLKDVKNSNKTLRNRNVEGLKVFWNFTYEGNRKYTNGKMYNYRDGRVYSGELTLSGDELKVRGYILGMTWLGGSTTMNRLK